MDAQAGYVCEGPIMARGLAAGAFWGMPLGVVILFVIAPPGWTGLLSSAGLCCVIGATIGGLVGLLSGVVLAVGEQTADATDRGRRKAAFITSAAPFLLLALLSGGVADPVFLLFCIVVALISGTAGALLAPWVVHRWRR